MCISHVCLSFLCHYWFEYECAVQTRWRGFCLCRLSTSLTISGSGAARPSLSPAVIVFLQVCLLPGFCLCLTELLRPVRTGLCPAVRLKTFIKGHRAKPLLWTRQQNIFCYLLDLLPFHFFFFLFVYLFIYFNSVLLTWYHHNFQKWSVI